MKIPRPGDRTDGSDREQGLREIRCAGALLAPCPRHGFSDTPCIIGQPYLGCGEHTARVFRQRGYDDADIDRLQAANVVGLPQSQLAERS